MRFLPRYCTFSQLMFESSDECNKGTKTLDIHPEYEMLLKLTFQFKWVVKHLRGATFSWLNFLLTDWWRDNLFYSGWRWRLHVYLDGWWCFHYQPSFCLSLGLWALLILHICCKYILSRVNDSLHRITHWCIIPFSYHGIYKDTIHYDVVNMTIAHFLLGCL